jgi:hypothetical protein
LIVCASAATARADTILINPGDPGDSFQSDTFPFTDLNGTALLGQTLDLDFVFTDNKFLTALFDSGTYRITLTLIHTGDNDTAPAGIAVNLSNQGGGNIQDASATTTLAAGPSLTYRGEFDNADGLAHFDVHFDAPLPSLSPHTIVAATISFAVTDPAEGNEIVVGQAEPISTASTFVGLLSMSITGLLGHSWLRRKQRLKVAH